MRSNICTSTLRHLCKIVEVKHSPQAVRCKTGDTVIKLYIRLWTCISLSLLLILLPSIMTTRHDCRAKTKGSSCLLCKWADTAIWLCKTVHFSTFFPLTAIRGCFISIFLKRKTDNIMKSAIKSIPANTRHQPNVALMLGQLCRRWITLGTTLVRSFVFCWDVISACIVIYMYVFNVITFANTAMTAQYILHHFMLNIIYRPNTL